MSSAERFNSLSHFIGAIVAALGAIVLFATAISQNDNWKLVSFIIYGLGLTALFTASTLYHAHEGKRKKHWQKIDHIMIYIFIASSYMPFVFVPLREHGGLRLGFAICCLALIGIASEFLTRKSRRALSMIIYLSMGWLILLTGPVLAEQLGSNGTQYLVAGGLIYTIGMGFYLFDHKIEALHGVWHLFVMVGSSAHYFAIFKYVAHP